MCCPVTLPKFDPSLWENASKNLEGRFYTGKQWDYRPSASTNPAVAGFANTPCCRFAYEDVELYYFNARWYDPETGRFITEDPVKDGLLWHSYCSNNPINFIDPTGLIVANPTGYIYIDTDTGERVNPDGTPYTGDNGNPGDDENSDVEATQNLINQLNQGSSGNGQYWLNGVLYYQSDGDWYVHKNFTDISNMNEADAFGDVWYPLENINTDLLDPYRPQQKEDVVVDDEEIEALPEDDDVADKPLEEVEEEGDEDDQGNILLQGFNTPTDGEVGSGFGTRIHPFTGREHEHTGIDYNGARNDPVIAAKDGIYSYSWSPDYGHVVRLDHGDGVVSIYGHLARGLPIPNGTFISQGTIIGYIGSSGRSTGPHLHFEVRIDGIPQDMTNYLE